MEIKIQKLSKEETEKLLATLPRTKRGKYTEVKKEFENTEVGGSVVLPIPYNTPEEYKRAKSIAGHMWNTFSKSGLAIVTQKNVTTTEPKCLYVIITKITRQK